MNCPSVQNERNQPYEDCSSRNRSPEYIGVGEKCAKRSPLGLRQLNRLSSTAEPLPTTLDEEWALVDWDAVVSENPRNDENQTTKVMLDDQENESLELHQIGPRDNDTANCPKSHSLLMKRNGSNDVFYGSAWMRMLEFLSLPPFREAIDHPKFVLESLRSLQGTGRGYSGRKVNLIAVMVASVSYASGATFSLQYRDQNFAGTKVRSDFRCCERCFAEGRDAAVPSATKIKMVKVADLRAPSSQSQKVSFATRSRMAHQFPDAMVSLRDPTLCHVRGTLHGAVFDLLTNTKGEAGIRKQNALNKGERILAKDSENYAEAWIEPGTVLVLQNATILRLAQSGLHVNIHPANVLQIFPADIEHSNDTWSKVCCEYSRSHWSLLQAYRSIRYHTRGQALARESDVRFPGALIYASHEKENYVGEQQPQVAVSAPGEQPPVKRYRQDENCADISVLHASEHDASYLQSVSRAGGAHGEKTRKREPHVQRILSYHETEREYRVPTPPHPTSTTNNHSRHDTDRYSSRIRCANAGREPSRASQFRYDDQTLNVNEREMGRSCASAPNPDRNIANILDGLDASHFR